MITVLYVDDEPGLLELGKAFLERDDNFSVTTVTSAPDALALMTGHDFDLVISDYQMPVMDGITFLQEVRSRYPSLPFILFTGRGREEIVIQAINNGVDFYLQKGGDPLAQFAELAHKIAVAVERRQVQNALRDSEQRLADIINFLPDATFAVNTEGTVIAWNRAIEDMTGVSASDMAGRGNYEYSLPFYGHRRQLLIDLILESEDVIQRGEYAITKKEGNVLIAETSAATARGVPKIFLCKASLLYNKEGNVAGAIESIRDITEARKAEDELRAAYGQITASEEEMRQQYEDLEQNQARLREANEQITAQEEELRGQYDEMSALQQRTAESQQMLAQVLNTVPVRVFWKDRDLRYLGCNEPFARDAGFLAPADLTGKTDFGMAWKEQAEAYRADDRIVIGSGIPKIGYEEPQTTPDGTRIWLRTSKIPLRDMQGTVRGILGTYEDITVSKNAEDTLRMANEQITAQSEELKSQLDEIVAGQQEIGEKEAKYRAIVDAFDGLIYICSPDYRVEFLNKNLIARTGYDGTGMPCHKVLHDLEEPCPWCVNDRVFAGEKVVWDTESPLDHRWYHVVNTPIRHPDGSVSKQAMITDITDRKQAEIELKRKHEEITAAYEKLNAGQQELRESEEMFRSLVQESSDGIVITDEDGKVVAWNDALSGITGIPVEEAVGSSYADMVISALVPEHRTPAHIGHVRSMIAGKDPAASSWFYSPRVEIEILRRDGVRCFIQQTVFPIRTPKGTRIGSIIQDITVSRKAAAALQESELRFRRLLERSFDAAVIHQNGVIVFANEPSARLMNVAVPSDLTGKAVMDLVDPVSEKIVRERIRTMTESPESVVPPVEERFRRPDGTIIDVEVIASPTEYGQKPAVLVLFRDISNRKAAEIALKESEKRYRQILQHASDAIIIHEVSRKQPGRLLEVNKKACEMLGYTRDELLQMSIPDLDVPEQATNIPEIQQLLFSGGTAVFPTEHRAKDGTRIPVEVSNTLITLDGRKVVMAVIRDMRNQKRAERVLRETNRKLSLLSSITRHDLRNKVTALSGYLALAKEKSENPVMRDYIGKLELIARSISGHIEYTRIYEDLGSAEPRWQEIGTVISSQQVPPELTLDADLPKVLVYADPILGKVFSNLIDNTVRHARNATTIRVFAAVQPDGLLIAWEDNGVGIPATQKEKIFSQGYGKNTGLGLFLSREILAITGITIRETGVPDKGARFEILVPKDAYRFAGSAGE
jgi:PAS domain S-box-containing protein